MTRKIMILGNSETAEALQGSVAMRQDVELILQPESESDQTPDCVFVAPNIDADMKLVNKQVVDWLTRGCNVIASDGVTISKSQWRAMEKACLKGNASFHRSGLFPHLLLERFALTLCKALQRVDHVRVVQAIKGEPSHSLKQHLFPMEMAAHNVARQLFRNCDTIRVEWQSIDHGVIQNAWQGEHCFLTCEQYWVDTEACLAPGTLPFAWGNSPYQFAVRVEGEPGLLESQLELEPLQVGVDPLAHVAAQGMLSAMDFVCDSGTGVVRNDASPCYQLDERMPTLPKNIFNRKKRKRDKNKPYRVVIWGPGEIGGAVTRAALQRNNIDIVGAKVFSPHKHGKDLGELVGVGPIGVKATTSANEIKALRPDCVIVTPQPRAITEGLDDDVIALLESGINVITSAAYHNVTMPNWLAAAQTPTALLCEVANTTGMARNQIEEVGFAINNQLMQAITRRPFNQLVPSLLDRLLQPVVKKAMPFRATPQRIQQACEWGAASLHGTGVHPTFMAERIGIQLATFLQKPRHMRFVEAADFSYMPDGMWGGLTSLGFGAPVEELDERYLVARAGDFYYGDVTGNVAHLLFGVPSTQVRLERSFRALPARRDFKVGSVTIKRGCAAALHMEHKGFIGDHHFFTNEECWYLGPEQEFRGEALPFGYFKTPISYTVEVQGEPSTLRMQLSMDGTGKAARMMQEANTSTADLRCALGQAMRREGVTNPITCATAMSIVDAVEAVCEAAPGVVIDDVRPQFKAY